MVVLIATLGGSISVASQDAQETIYLIDNEQNFPEPLPIYVEITCQKLSCSGLQLEVFSEDGNYTVADPHEIRLSYLAQGNVSLKLSANPETTLEHLTIKMTESINQDSNLIFKEEMDWLDNVPSPGINVEQIIVDSNLVCPIDTCKSPVYSNTHWIVGMLEDDSDRDSIHIQGDWGDIIHMPAPLMPNSVELEFWIRNDTSKNLLNDIQDRENGEFLFEYPDEGELWLRLKQLPESSFTSYELYIFTFSKQFESSWGELSSAWGEQQPLSFPNETERITGWISSEDFEGDSIRIKAASRMNLILNCSDRFGEVNFQVFLLSDNESSSPVEENCSSPILTNVDTESIEIRMTSDSLAEWSIGLTENPKGDAGAMGDAPDRLWKVDDDLSKWPRLHTNHSISATMASDESVDVFSFEVTSTNGSRLHIDYDYSQPVSYQILILNQESGLIINTSKGGLIDAPTGIHAIRVEKIGERSLTSYDFTLVNNGEVIEEKPDTFTDQSSLFASYYIFAGLFLLAPAMLVLFWNRDRWRDGLYQIEIEQHELRRLRRLRERLTNILAKDDLNEQVIDSALHQLGDSPWQAVVEDWGAPLLRHNTKQIEICAWKILEGATTLLIGIRVDHSPWELAAMRVYAPEGANVSIAQVSPKHLFNGDEIFLDTLAPNSKTFLKLAIEGEPSNIGFHLSGLVDGEPLAAVPNKAIDWS